MIFTSNPLYDIFKEINHQLGGKNLVGGEVKSDQAVGQLVLKLQLQCEQFPRSHCLLCFKTHLCVVFSWPEQLNR